MKKDILFVALIALLFAPFFVYDELYAWYQSFNASNAFVMAFLKFAILATVGEMLGLRIKTGSYSQPGFGIMPRAIVWGFLGMWIAASMKIFAIGAPQIVEYLGVEGTVAAMKEPFSVQKLLGAFATSLAMNTSFAPVFMTVHKITDTHIMNNGGKLRALVTPLPFGKLLASLNWDVQWSFVFKKTIPYFWIPAHTITFILPTDFQVLFAAVLGIALGILLAVAAVKGR